MPDSESSSSSSSSSDGLGIIRKLSSTSAPRPIAAVAGSSSPCSSRIDALPAERLAKRLVYLFVNPTSGGNAASAFTTARLEHAAFTDPMVDLYICDIREGPSGKKPGFLALKEKLIEVPAREEVCVIAAGGDGTVMWCASELWAHEIDDSNIVIGVLPYGTGNDFARALKWNVLNAVQPWERDLKMLRHLCSLWTSKPVVYHDVWEVAIELYPAGCFKQIDSKTRVKKILTDNGEKTGRKLSQKMFKMNNYLSIGVESRIGIGFDRHRTTSQKKNKMVYINEGLKKMLFKRTAPVDKLLANMTTREHGQEDVIFTTEASSHTMLKPAMSLIASNIPSFASGLDIWKACADKPLGITGGSEKKDLSLERQQMGDGMLEFVTFGSTLSLGCEQAFTGHGRRVHKGAGPFTLNFKALANDLRVYFQVDGEFFIMTSPKSVEIRNFKKLKVLANAEACGYYNPVKKT